MTRYVDLGCEACGAIDYHLVFCPFHKGWQENGDDSPYTTDDMELDTDADIVFDFEEELEG